jgi:hypothetical protein
MATWIEFRCENRDNPSAHATPKNWGERCDSHDNNGPMEMSNDNQKSIIATVQYLEREAKKSGWKKTKYGWICKYCAGRPTVMDELKSVIEY